MARTRWEYARVEMNSSRAQIDGEWLSRSEMLTRRGGDGWELVTVLADSHEKWEAFYFKRPIEPVPIEPVRAGRDDGTDEPGPAGEPGD